MEIQGKEPDFSEARKAYENRMKKELAKSIISFGGTSLNIYYVCHDGQFLVHFVYKGFKWTLGTNTTAQKYNVGFGFCHSNGYRSSGYGGFSSSSKPVDNWYIVSSVDFKNAFKKIEKLINDKDYALKAVD